MSESRFGWFKWVVGSVIIAVVPVAAVTQFGLRDSEKGGPTVVVNVPANATTAATKPTGGADPGASQPKSDTTPGTAPPSPAGGAGGAAEGRRAAVSPPLTGEKWRGVRTTSKGLTGEVELVVSRGDGRELKGRIRSVPEDSGASFEIEGELVGNEVHFSRWPQLNGGKTPKGALTGTGLGIAVQQPNGGVAQFEFFHP
jgi:hypothetical protein